MGTSIPLGVTIDQHRGGVPFPGTGPCDAPCSQLSLIASHLGQLHPLAHQLWSLFLKLCIHLSPQLLLTHGYFLKQRKQPHSTLPLQPPASPQALNSGSLLQVLNYS